MVKMKTESIFMRISGKINDTVMFYLLTEDV